MLSSRTRFARSAVLATQHHQGMLYCLGAGMGDGTQLFESVKQSVESLVAWTASGMRNHKDRVALLIQSRAQLNAQNNEVLVLWLREKAVSRSTHEIQKLTRPQLQLEE